MADKNDDLLDRFSELQQDYNVLRARADDSPAFRSARAAFRATLDRALSLDGQDPRPLTPPSPVPARPALNTQPISQRLVPLALPEMAARIQRVNSPAPPNAAAETTITPDLQKLAQSLGNDPVRIYEWVYNNITYQPYYGVRQTAQTTYENRTGNDADTSSLLVTLLRAAGVEAEYVVADVAIPGPLPRNWLGHATTATAAQAVLVEHPNVRITQDDRLIKPHIFVAARVSRAFSIRIPMAMRSQTQSRGIGQAMTSAAVTSALTGAQAWVYLDASVKELSIRPPASAEPFITDDAETFWSTARSSAQWEVRHPGATNQLRMMYHPPRLFTDGNADVDADDVDYLAQIADGINGKLEAYLAANPNAKAADLLGESTIVTKSISALPLSFPFLLSANAAPAQSAALPDALRTMVTISLLPDTRPETTATVLEYTADYATLSAGRVSISYEPATEGDRQIVESSGGTYLTAPIGFNVVPVLRVDGTQVAVGPKSSFGTLQTKHVKVAPPNRPAFEFSNVISAGDTSIVKLAPARFNPVALERNKATLQDLAEQRAPDTLGAPGEDLIGPMLDILASDYFGQVDTFNDLLSRANNVRYWNDQAAGFANQALDFKRIFGVNFGVEGTTFQLDIKSLAYRTVSLRDNQEDVTRVRRLDALNSALEHAVFEQRDLSAFSTVRVLNEAAERGIPIVTVDKATVFAGRLNSRIYSLILKYLDEGFEVTTPIQPVKIGDATTTGVFGFVARHPDGRSSYIIGSLGNQSPSLHGGQLLENIKKAAAVIGAATMVGVSVAGTLGCVSGTLGLGTVGCLALGGFGLHVAANLYFDVVEDKTSPETFFTDGVRDLLIGKLFKLVPRLKEGYDALPPNVRAKMDEVLEQIAKHLKLDELAARLTSTFDELAHIIQQFGNKVDACTRAYPQTHK